VLLASGAFVLRGPLRASSGYVSDFAAPYVSTRLWLEHKNPYDSAAFFSTWHSAGAPTGTVYANPSSSHSLYPPPTLVVLIPFAVLPWAIATKALLLLSMALYLTALILLATFVPGSWQDSDKPFFLATGLALAPAHSALHVTNIACLGASLLLLAIYALLRRSSKPAALLPGACIALVICLKPTLGILILPYLIWTRAWRTLVVTLALICTIGVVSLYPLLSLGGQWLSDLRGNIAFVFTNGGVADLAPQNLTRFDRIDLQLPLYALLHHRNAAAVTALIVACLLVFWSSSRSTPNGIVQRDTLDISLLRVATLLIIGLLPFYQRYYSAIVVLLPILWAFRNLSQPRARWLLLLCSTFLINTEALLQATGTFVAISAHLPFVADAIIGPHLCWIILLLAIVLVKMLRHSTAPTQSSQLDFASGNPNLSATQRIPQILNTRPNPNQTT